MRPLPLLPLLFFLPAAQAAPLSSSAAERETSPGIEEQTSDAASRVFHRQARLVTLFRTLEKTLEPVQDKASADAAAPDVLRLARVLHQIREESHQTSEQGPLAEEAMDAWREKYGKAFTKLTARAFGKAFTLSLAHPACYGSAALDDALSQLFAELEKKETSPSEKGE